MSIHFYNSGIALVTAFAFFLQAGSTTQLENPKSFEMTISLPSPQMHIDEEVVVTTVISNPTDHVLYAGQGRGGIAMELLDANGVDVGRRAMGNYKKDQLESPVISSGRQALRAGYKREITFRWKPDPGSLIPGVYKLRVYRRDMGAGITVYSNSATLTVIP
jgi:hypothetical protein